MWRLEWSATKTGAAAVWAPRPTETVRVHLGETSRKLAGNSRDESRQPGRPILWKCRSTAQPASLTLPRAERDRDIASVKLI